MVCLFVWFGGFLFWFFLFGLGLVGVSSVRVFLRENGNCVHTTRRKRGSVNTYVIFAYICMLYSSCSGTEKYSSQYIFLICPNVSSHYLLFKRKKKMDLLKSC